MDCNWSETTPGYPWLQSAMAFAPTAATSLEAYPASRTAAPSGGLIFPAAIGDLIVVALYFLYVPSGDFAAPPYEIDDTSDNVWTGLPPQTYTDDDGNIYGLQVWWAIANSTETTISTNCPCSVDGGEDEPAWGLLAIDTFSCGGNPISFDSMAQAQGTSGVPDLTITPAWPWPLVVSHALLDTVSGGSPYIAPGEAFSALFAGGGEDGELLVAGEYQIITYEGPPPPPPPLRYKRLPLKLDFASCSFDQADRLLMYELYRACGLDPSNPFLAALLDWGSPPSWQPPITLSLTVWGEAVDEMWNILKSGMASGDTAPRPICGKVITIDSVNYPEWCGDWEIVQCEYAPFAGQAAQNYGSQGGGVVTGNSDQIGAPAEGSGMLSLTLRTYNAQVFFDSSMTPSWIDVPGPWADGSY